MRMLGMFTNSNSDSQQFLVCYTPQNKINKKIQLQEEIIHQYSNWWKDNFYPSSLKKLFTLYNLFFLWGTPATILDIIWIVERHSAVSTINLTMSPVSPRGAGRRMWRSCPLTLMSLTSHYAEWSALKTEVIKRILKVNRGVRATLSLS